MEIGVEFYLQTATLFGKIVSFSQNTADLNYCIASVDEHDDYISSGPGLEQSAITEVFRRFFEEREHEFCTPLYGEYTTLQSADLQISSNKHDELVLFGAATGLALIYGHYPGHLNPLLLIYLLNDCNISCLHHELVSSYLPSISETLERWLNIGPMDSIAEFSSHFASYHNIQVRHSESSICTQLMSTIACSLAWTFRSWSPQACMGNAS